jgi:Receptor family ligand binding region
LRIPQIAYATIGSRLSEQAKYPSFSSVIPEAYDFGATIAKFFQRDIFKRDAAAVIYEKSDFGAQFESPIEDFEDILKYFTVAETISSEDDLSIRKALREVKEAGIRTIVVIADRPRLLEDVAHVADEMEILGEGYFYMIIGGAIPPEKLRSLRYGVDSPTDRMLRGAAVFTNCDPFKYYGDNDPFLRAWKEQDGATIIPKLNSIQPVNQQRQIFYTASASFFQDEIPTEYASFMYDAVITAGISACEAQLIPETEKTMLIHIQQVMQADFSGASGRVRFKTGLTPKGEKIQKNSREAADVVFGVYNIRSGPVYNNTRG